MVERRHGNGAFENMYCVLAECVRLTLPLCLFGIHFTWIWEGVLGSVMLFGNACLMFVAAGNPSWKADKIVCLYESDV